MDKRQAAERSRSLDFYLDFGDLREGREGDVKNGYAKRSMPTWKIIGNHRCIDDWHCIFSQRTCEVKKIDGAK